MHFNTDHWEDILILYICININRDKLGEVNQHNLDGKFWGGKGYDVVGKAFWSTFFIPTDHPVEKREKTGDHASEAAERDTVVGEFHHKWLYGRRGGNILVEFKISDVW